ncbi:MAG TPA: hypothetical protein VID26_11255 [Candidatus Limnocylindrales bacterium]|jgi:hypothetical protein
MAEPTSPSNYTADAERFFVRAREIVPSFVAVDDDGAEQWQDNDGPLGYIRIAALAWHLTSRAEIGKWDEVKAILDVAETTIESGDAYTSELMVVGLLEDFQNACLQSEGRVRLVDVRALLGPASLAAWDDLMRFWHGSGTEARERLPPGSLPDET